MDGAQESYDGTYQIAELMDVAQDHFNLSREDAVFLLDSERRSLDMDGRWSTHIHRIIWIGTGLGIRRYGDHRINYDYDRCEFKDITVRTWRDGQWWTTGETGMVETLPYSGLVRCNPLRAGRNIDQVPDNAGSDDRFMDDCFPTGVSLSLHNLLDHGKYLPAGFFETASVPSDRRIDVRVAKLVDYYW